MIRKTLQQLFDAMSFANVGNLGEFHRLMETQPRRAHEGSDRQRPPAAVMPLPLRLVPKRSSSR
jgi:hypothetical protein